MLQHRKYVSIIVPEGIGWPHAWCSLRKDLGCLAAHAKKAGFRTAELAERLGTSTRALRRECRNSLGLSLKDWLVQVRLVEARTRLRGNESIGEIAWSLGFSHTKELSREFRKLHGATPSEFRAKARAASLSHPDSSHS
jgi:AraC-like DNA-binding protein